MKMFRVPNYLAMTMTVDEAAEIMTRHGRGDMLVGMEAMDRAWKEHVASFEADTDLDEADTEFYEAYVYEVSAYNVVFEGMYELVGTGA
jgi:hypothetical protein